MRASLLGVSVGCAAGLSVGVGTGVPSGWAVPYRMRAVTMMSEAVPEVAEAEEAAEAPGPQRREAYYCNDEGCWIAEQVMCDETGCWIEEPTMDTPVTLPDGRSFSFASGVESHESLDERDGAANKREPAMQGIFAPAVLGAKAVLGKDQLNKLRADVIVKHSSVISKFVDTSESEFGQIVLKRLFEAADKDNNGTLDKQEVRDALNALGFTFIDNKQLDSLFKRADKDKNEVIDFEEFAKETPKTLRTNLVKLAKKNGHDLGFLV